MHPAPQAAPPRWSGLLLPALLAAALTVLGFFPSVVEKAYSRGLYPPLSVLVRLFTRWIPFSLGDVIYIVFFLWVSIGLARFSVRLVRKKLGQGWLGRGVYRFIRMLLWLYIAFQLLWALNYSRLGVAHQLQLQQTGYQTTEIVNLTDALIDKLNETRRQLPDSILPEKPMDSILRGAFRAYQQASFANDFMNYRNRSVKKSLFTGLADYMGFTGYYNPFSGEAQVRTDVPHILMPYIVCHEIAHQLGYASETEANFVGYLAAAASEDPYFRYSVYLELFSYAQGEELALLATEKDRTAFDSAMRRNRLRLDTLVKTDRRAIREFFYKRRNRVSPVVSNVYDQYLKMNRQAGGIRSYDEVIGLLVAYHRKYGKL